jgi:hypothetical protein
MAIQKIKETYQVFIKGRWEARKDYISALRDGVKNLIGSGILSTIFPPLSVIPASFQLLRYIDFISEYFTPPKRYHYEVELKPLLTAKHFFKFGYEVSLDELDEHLAVLNAPNFGKLLSLKEKKVKSKEQWRIIGVDKDQLTRHFLIFGTTGAGKTSFLMVIFEKLFSLGGGLIFVDGKAEDVMFKKLYSLAKKYNRERDVFLINFLVDEGDRESTNTFNPIITFFPVQTVAFLSALMGDASGDQSYWQGRGKALLRPIVFFYFFRKKYYGELFSYENIQSGLEIQETTLLAVLTYALALAYEEQLATDSAIQRLYNEGKRKKTPSTDFPYMEVLRTLFILAPQKRKEFELLGYDPSYLEALFKVYTLFRTYIAGVKQTWWNAVRWIAEQFYKNTKTQNILEMKLDELRLALNNTVNELSERAKDKESGFTDEEKQFITIYKDPNVLGDAIEQHGYANQQWTDIFSQIETFSFIFGALNPEVDFVDVLKNNKIVYVLLPALKYDPSTTNLLGKMVVQAIKQACSVVLGGKIEMHKDEKAILESRYRPKPLGMVVLDEYGAYPISGLDTIFAQVRSLNISFMVSVQDYQSIRPEGKEGGDKRVWGNASKIAFLTKDDEVLEKLNKYISEEYATRYQTKAYSTTDVIQSSDVAIEKTVNFDPKKLLSAKYGFGMAYIDRPVLFQSFWADAPVPEYLNLIHFEEIE